MLLIPIAIGTLQGGFRRVKAGGPKIYFMVFFISVF
jgi:hypothetical protein